ncbi:spore germination protein [Calidifontibacillus erzurumensis]|uniref:Spore germination protein n=1 Tax=Calidifontibacillus erzurumensis TaxID=2741433 RepID=A0A8J8GEQ0_9BACI|nr:spore germination protein [Calidifontibacillus erzurumensis]NSL50458.1 spore germination protein [Calidifontibacillus erzurumensis]
MLTQTKEKQPISTDLRMNEEFLKDRIGLGTSFDLGVRKIKILKKDVHVYFLNGLCDSAYIIELLKVLIQINDHERSIKAIVKDIIKNRLSHQQVQEAKDMDQVVDQLLSGLMIILIEGETIAFSVDVRSYPGRNPEEPDTEKVVRGARDGYTENIVVNTALTRRRIRDERLRHEIIQVGERSKTDICIAYLQDVADPDLVEIIKKELKEIEIDGIPMADKTVEEFLVKQGWNPYPMVRYTERPDVVATHLLEGHVVIMVDTSPSMIITPTTFFHHVQHAEEYRQTPAIGAFLRWVRFIGMVVSVLLVPLWYLFVKNPDLLPEAIDFIGPNKEYNIPIIVQLIIASLGIDLLRMAAIHTPTPLSTAMGLIAAALIGQIAIDVGLFSAEVILYVAVSAIGLFATPSYELSVANKISQIGLLLAVYFFDVAGLVIGITVIILYLASLRSLNTPYLWPFIPFDPHAFLQIIVRVAMPLNKTRPTVTNPQNNKKQPFRKPLLN